MNVVLLLLLFLLGLLIGAITVAIYYQTMLVRQLETERQYQTLVRKQLDQLQELLVYNWELRVSNGALQEKILRLRIQREQLLASLN